MPKNAYFWKKSCKIAAASEARRTPHWFPDGDLSPDPRVVTPAYSFVECISSVKHILLLRKITEQTANASLYDSYYIFKVKIQCIIKTRIFGP